MSTDSARHYQAAIQDHHNPYELPDIPSSSPPSAIASPHDSILPLDDIFIQRPKALYPSIRPGRTAAWIRERRAMHPYRVPAPVEEVRSVLLYSADVESQTTQENRSYGACCCKLGSDVMALIVLVIVALIIAAWVVGGRK